MTNHPREGPGDWPLSSGEWPARGERPAVPPHGRRAAGFSVTPGYPASPDYPPGAVFPAMPDYPPTPDYPDYPPTPDYPPAAGYPAAPGSPSAADHPPVPGSPPVPPPGGHQGRHGAPSGAGDLWSPAGPIIAHDEYVHPPGHSDRTGAPLLSAPEADENAGPADPSGRPASVTDARRAMLAYLAVPFFGFVLPLAIYLLALRRSRWVRAHAAQAVNVWITAVIYDLSGVIMGAMLALDASQVAVLVMVPLAALLWLVTLVFLVRAAIAAGRGEEYSFPRWLCTAVVR